MKLQELSLQEQFEKINCLIKAKDWRHLNFVCEQIKLDPIVMLYFKDVLDWRTISHYQELDMNFIREMKDYVDWDRIWQYQKYLSEDFIDEFIDKADWWNICLFRDLSEKFMDKHSDKLKWDIISSNQKMSEAFIDKYADKIEWERITIIKNVATKLTPYLINKYKDTYLKDYMGLLEYMQ